ncbi:MAG: response regulator transcription factor [Bryobacteraceae bacterium]
MNVITIFVCESQPIIIEGLHRIFERGEEFQLSGHTVEIESCVLHLGEQPVDILLYGQPPRAKSVLPAIAQLRETVFPSHLVVWVTEMGEVDQFRALQLGARGIVTRTQPVDVFLECLRTVARGAVWFEGASRLSERKGHEARITKREREVINQVCKGLKNREIGEALSITPGTVKVHLMHIFEKTGLKDRYHLALEGRKLLGDS